MTGRVSRWRGLTMALWLVAAAASAQTPATPQGPFEPKVGQAGKDVVWVPTPQALVDRMLDMAKVTPQDYLIDLGSGDGRNIIAAAKRGARALGVEFNPEMVKLSEASAAKEGVAPPKALQLLVTPELPNFLGSFGVEVPLA